jgi:hypothetical protein
MASTRQYIDETTGELNWDHSGGFNFQQFPKIQGQPVLFSFISDVLNVKEITGTETVATIPADFQFIPTGAFFHTLSTDSVVQPAEVSLVYNDQTIFSSILLNEPTNNKIHYFSYVENCSAVASTDTMSLSVTTNGNGTQTGKVFITGFLV